MNLAERHSFNFEHDLLKTREITFNNVDLIRVPQMAEQNIYLADRHQYNWGENPSLTTKKLRFNNQFKIKIPQNKVSNFAIPERHNFNYNSNSLDVKKVNFDHIKSIRVEQAEAYDVNLADFRFESLKKGQYPSATQATAIDTQFTNKPIPKIEQRQPESGAKVSLGGNLVTVPDYVAPIRIRQEYNPYGVHTTADVQKANTGALRNVPEPEQVVPTYVPPTTPVASRGSAYPKYEAAQTYPTYQPSSQTASTSSASVAPTPAPTPTTYAAPAPSTYAAPAPTAYRAPATSAYPRYNSNTGSNRVYGSPYTRY